MTLEFIKKYRLLHLLKLNFYFPTITLSSIDFMDSDENTRWPVSSKVYNLESISLDGSTRILKGIPVSLSTSELFKIPRYAPSLFITFFPLMSLLSRFFINFPCFTTKYRDTKPTKHMIQIRIRAIISA